MKKITITDIARKLKTTPSTVSRALANNERVSLKTRELVKKTAKEMGYQPNLMASALRKGKNDTIGMIVPRINRHFFSNVISGVEEILKPAGYNLIISQSNERIDDEIKAIDSMIKNRVGGIIISISAETNNFDHLSHVADNHIPLVQFDRVVSEVVGPQIVNDNFTGAYNATKHLIESGYKNIAHFAGPFELKSYVDRYNGYKKALEEAGLKEAPNLIIENVITRQDAHQAFVNNLVHSNADAIFCAGDYAALGAFDACKASNISVPNDFGIMGFANEPFAELMSPTLSTVEQNAFDMGNKAALAMIDKINGEKENKREIVPVKVLVRESSLKNNNQ